MQFILIYSPSVTERLLYILDFFWKNNYKIAYSLDDFKNYAGPKICYSEERIEAVSYWIAPAGLLFENHIRQQNCTVSYWGQLPIFFQTKGDLGFDIFSAGFYLITRYEEYLPHDKDKYGRFSETNALAYRAKFLRLPLVDMWFQRLELILKERFSDYVPVNIPFQYTPTFDIDMPFAYLHKPLYVQTGAFIKNVLAGRKKNIRRQIQTWQRRVSDPFDTFTFLNEQIRQYAFAPVFFFPVAKKYGRYDKNPSQSNSTFRQLIRQISGLFEVGIHPSWQSGDSKASLKQEKDFLEETSGKKITKSRQHYLRMTLPETYQNLIELGIEEDYSMGYGNIDGFRAGTCRSFYWFDLSKNKSTCLQIHPFCWMDATAYHHTKDTPGMALQNLQYYYETISQVGGQMITIMHNNYFAETAEYISFRKIMPQFWQNTFSNSVPCKEI